jgi:hypothetical protein
MEHSYHLMEHYKIMPLTLAVCVGTFVPLKMHPYVTWLAGASLASFGWMLCDKSLAGNDNGTRVPERLLHILNTLGGTPGIILGMLFANHKTSSAKWQLAFLPACVVACVIHLSALKSFGLIW